MRADSTTIHPLILTTYAGSVGSFTDEDPDAEVSDYQSVVIDWGDGTSSGVTLIPQGGGRFDVHGDHDYEEEGTYQIHTEIVEPSGNTTAIDSTAEVSKPSITAFPLTIYAQEGRHSS